LDELTSGRARPPVPACPSCDASVLEPVERALVSCPCGQRFEVAVFHPQTRVSSTAVALAAGSAPCARHAGNAAVSSCEHCGAFMCELCRIEEEGVALCAACFERLAGAGKLASTRISFRNYNGVALSLAVAGLIPFLGVLAGPLAMLLAQKGLRQGRELGETHGVTWARVALGLGALELVGGVLAWASFFGGTP
jgi:hypothetical protein